MTHNHRKPWALWPTRPPSFARRATTGAVAAAAALSIASLVAAVLPEGRSPIVALGEEVISLAPPALRQFAITVLGTYDKPVIVVGTVLIAVLAGAWLGAASRHDRLPLIIGTLGLLAVGVAATADTSPSGIVPGVVAALAAAGAASVVVGVLTRHVGDGAPSSVESDAGGTGETVAAAETGYTRRQFAAIAGAFTAVALLADTISALVALGASTTVATARNRMKLPGVDRPLPPPRAGTSLGIPGISPLFTANDVFYRIDTALFPPAIDPSNWRLQIDGMVLRPLSYSYDDLMRLPQIQADITLCCVSDEVGGDLIGNARWQGVRLDHLLGLAGVREGATQLVGRSVDGFTAGFPTIAALDGRDALVAVGMNGEPLPVEHGFPARLIVPGLYGYVSATKWLAQIHLTTFEAFAAFWTQRGWAHPAPVHTESRIDVPRAGSSLAAGSSVIAGVAWAQHVGIRTIEVRVDGGRWVQADLAEPLGIDTWRQWRLRWAATHGTHTIEVRATDANGAVQPQRRSDPYPDGATGWHTVKVSVV